MQARLADLSSGGSATTLSHYRFDAIHVSLLIPFGRQTGLSLGLAGTGTVTEESVDPGGAVRSLGERPFELTFAMRQATGERWMIVAVLEPDEVPR
jgi:hypothetical protein